MTVFKVIGAIVVFFLIPYLAGNIYGLAFRKKNMGIVATYLAGMASVYGGLTIIQLAIIKFKFDFNTVAIVYHIFFAMCILFGGICLWLRNRKNKVFKWDISISKKSLWVLGLVFLQGILYIVLKNPYFEDNALLETARVTLETGTVYEYNAFTGNRAAAGFPLANKLMFLPMVYAYVGKLSGLDMALLFNFVMPSVTFISFYLVMTLWLQTLAREYKMNWERMLFMLVWIVQIGDGWNHATAFRILHSGYTGEALFFGVLAAFAIYSIKNKCYLMACMCLLTFPGLIKYDAVIDLLKSFKAYWGEGAFFTGMILLYTLAVIYFAVKDKKATAKLLNLNLTVCLFASRIFDTVVCKEDNVKRKTINGVVVLLVLFMCGNIKLISDGTEWRSNPYGAAKTEYELLEMLDNKAGTEKLKVAACDEMAKWIKRLDMNIEPVVGYDLGGKEIWWYSNEQYDELYRELWQNVNVASADSEQELMRLTDEIEVDYIVVRRITELIPIQNNKELECVYDSPSYLVYYVDKN